MVKMVGVGWYIDGRNFFQCPVCKDVLVLDTDETNAPICPKCTE